MVSLSWDEPIKHWVQQKSTATVTVLTVVDRGFSTLNERQRC
jgi:hypothetical protein